MPAMTTRSRKTTATRSDAEELFLAFARDRRLAHEVLFKHRHLDPSPPFHFEIIEDFHSPAPFVVDEAFRGASKSTRAEEVIALRAGFREFRNAIVVGSSEARAMERLRAVKHEIETNEAFQSVFGNLVGPVWTEHKVELANGVLIQAFGRGQSLRGAKHLDQRPDFCLIDDLEDEDTIATPEARMKSLRWLYKTLLPALDKNCRVRFIGNRLHPEAVIVQVAKDPAWLHRSYPIMYRGDGGLSLPGLPPGEWLPTWPERFPLDWIAAKRDEYARLGILRDFNQEYMCEAEAEEEKPFRPEMIRVEPRLRTWEATWAMVDPARTVKASSASTGLVVFSWLSNRLVVWEGLASMLMPDAIISEMFRIDSEYRPVVIGVEEDGLNEFILQPLRHEQVRRGHPLPIRAMRAPKGKLDFIRSLQPFFNAGEVEFAKDLPDLKQQLLSFPTGRIDAPNALAYALKLRPGSPIYEDFTRANVVEDLQPLPGRPLWLALNATGGYVTAALLQYGDQLRVLADWVEEGDPGQAAPHIVSLASLEASRPLRHVAPPQHFERYTNVGLQQAIARLPAELRRGADPSEGREEIRSLLRRQVKGLPAVMVSHNARWTLNGFAGGYARAVTNGGIIADHASDGLYKTLMEGIESFGGLLRLGASDDERQDVSYAVSRDGRRYVSAMPGR